MTSPQRCPRQRGSNVFPHVPPTRCDRVSVCPPLPLRPSLPSCNSRALSLVNIACSVSEPLCHCRHHFPASSAVSWPAIAKILRRSCTGSVTRLLWRLSPKPRFPCSLGLMCRSLRAEFDANSRTCVRALMSTCGQLAATRWHRWRGTGNRAADGRSGSRSCCSRGRNGKPAVRRLTFEGLER